MKLFTLFWVFALLSILAVGGGTAVLPQMQHMTVDQFHWVSNKQFRDIYSIGQVAPGPNMLMVMLIGYKLAGFLGAAVVGFAFFLPDCILTLFANRLWVHFAASPWRRAVQRGMAPVAIGLMLAGTVAIAKLAVFNLVGAAIAITVFGVLLWRHVNPALLIMAGGVIYIAAMFG
ncbi:MAG: chromate transporter [Candidatus Binataceae bacterium]|nr:chromate transporter [Candidatus Binataceae bacterium]